MKQGKISGPDRTLDSPAITTTLQARGSVYGGFVANAMCSQELKSVMQAHVNRKPLAADQQEALELIALKISRILTGDPEYLDNWVDIAGYAQLVVNRLEKR